MTVQQIFSVCVLVGIFILIIKKILDARIAFTFGGIILLLVSKNFDKLLDLIKISAVSLKISAIIVFCAFGFAEILKTDKYPAETLSLLKINIRGGQKKFNFIPITIALIATFIGSFTLLSANASCGIVAPFFFPILIGMGLSPQVASAAIIIGAWGTIMHPGDINALMIDLVHKNCKMDLVNVMRDHLIPTITAIVVMVVTLSVIGRRKNSVSVASNNVNVDTIEIKNGGKFKIRAIVSFLPFILLILYNFCSFFIVCSNEERPKYAKIAVVASLLLCSLLAIILARYNTRRRMCLGFIKGGIAGIFDIIILMITSMVFINSFLVCFGKNDITALINGLGVYQIIAAVVITAILTILSGSGDAIITSCVQIFVPSIIASGIPASVPISSMIWFAGEIGRCASPVAAATRTVAKEVNKLVPEESKVEADQIASKAFFPVILGLITSELILYFFHK